jgi:hypothetical protein
MWRLRLFVVQARGFGCLPNVAVGSSKYLPHDDRNARAAKELERLASEVDQLEHVPPELNRQDSHGVLDRRFYRH